jgi:peptide/nickel transport system substrate-binding protein
VRSLFKKRIFGPIEGFEKKLSSSFTPSDWFVVGVLGVVMALAAGTLLAGVSVALTVEVPEHGGTYTEGVVGTPRFVNPLLAISDTDRDLSELVYSGLMKEGPDGSLSADLASSYSLSTDKLTYTFTLRDDARFQDGTPVTADDVAFTVQEAQNPDIKSPLRANWQGVDVEVIDQKTVSFTLKSPYAPFPENTTVGILPKHLWQAVTAEEFPFTTLNARPVGSGPYRITNVLQNSSGIPTAYRLAAFTSSVRTPYISTFVMKFYPDAATLESAFNQGEVAAAYGVNPSAITAAHAVDEAIFGRVFAVFFNQNQNSVFADSAVRQALDAAVDKDALIQSVLSGYGSAIDGPLPPPEAGEKAPDALSPAERIARAQAILTNDGWKLGADGVFAKTTGTGKKTQTVRLAFAISTSNAPELKSAASAVAADWKALGADVTTQFFDQGDLSTDVIQPRKYDALLFGLVVGRDSDLYPFWHSSQMADPGLNVALYANKNVDALLEKARSESDPILREKDTASAAQLIAADTAAVFLYTPHFVYLSPPAAKGIALDTIDTPSDRFVSVDGWYLMTERIWPVSFANIRAFAGKLFHW